MKVPAPSPVWTVARIRARKGGAKIACLTAADAGTARLLDAAGIPLILVGDSLGMTVLGYDTTLPVTLTAMLHHTAAVVRGVRAALVVADMPFGTYQSSPAQAVRNAARFLQEAGAAAVKLEGGAERARTVRTVVAAGIPVMGHIGLLPQSVRAEGYRVRGRDPAEAERLVADARVLEAAGAFSIVIEGVPAAVARAVTAAVGVPTIGIGAGPHCDGQVLVLHDLLGLPGGMTPKFVKRYIDLAPRMARAVGAYRRDVESGRFPGPRHTYA